MFIISLTYKKALSEVDQYIDAHIKYLEKYYALNKFMISGRKVPRTGGVIICKAESLAEVDSIIKEDPFFQSDVADYDITEFTPTMTTDDLSLLRDLK